MKHPVILITGASRGIGREIALTFARQGYRCAITCIHRREELRKVSEEILSLGCDCLPFVGDVGNYSDCCQLFERIEARFGRLDVLVNNAGISHIGLIQEMTPDQWDRLIQTNLSSCFYCSKLAIPMMLKEKSGNIIHISSVWGQTGASCEAAYSAAKAGMNGFSRALAKELGPSGIRVNAVACGVIDTEMNQCFSDEEREVLREQIPLGRFGTPGEVGQFVYSLVHQAPYLNGQVISYDGGWI